jgi:predicted ABC-type ATPase
MKAGRRQPVCYVVAGPNGAGKTTFAMYYLKDVAHCAEFVNTDLIAHGLSPLNQQSVQFQAARLFLQRIRELSQRNITFAFESTLSGKGHARFLDHIKKIGYKIELNYLWLPSAEFSARRVALRVAAGGHDVPGDVIARRFPKSVHNLVTRYLSLADFAAVWDNSARVPARVVEKSERGIVVFNETIWNEIKETGTK